MFRWIKRTRRRTRDWFKDRSRYIRWQWHRVTSGTLAWWESLKTTHEDGPVSVVESAGGKRARPALKLSSFFNPFFWFASTFQFLLRYLFSRRPVDFAISLPAIMGLGIPAGFVYAYVPSESELIGKCRNQIILLGQQNKYGEAIFYSKLWQAIAQGDPQACLAEADLHKFKGDLQESRRLLEQLFARTGYEPALVRICREDLELAVSGNLDADREKNLTERLAWLDQRLPDDAELQFMIGTYHMDRRDNVTAASAFRKSASKQSPIQVDALLSQALCELRLNRLAVARTTASLGADLSIQQLASFDTNPESLKKCCQLLVLSSREDEAVSLLQGRLEKASEEQRPALRFLTAEVLTRWCERRRSEGFRDSQDMAGCLELLARALRSFPEHEAALNELAWFASNVPGGTEVDTMLQQILDSGVDPGFLHFVLGTRAAVQSPPDVALAKQHFERSIAHNAGYPTLLNNLADVIARNEDSDETSLKSAMELVQQAIVFIPDAAEVFDTRGKLRHRLGDYKGAIADFELALKSPRCRVSAYEGLAKAYLELGDNEKSLHYRDLAGRAGAGQL